MQATSVRTFASWIGSTLRLQGDPMMKIAPVVTGFVSALFLNACAGDAGEPVVGNAMAADSTPTSRVTSARADEKTPTSAGARTRNFDGFDIAGLHLGMSPEEVTAVLKAYDPGIVIKQDAVSFTYTALGQRHKTESFVNYMSGTVPGGAVSLDVRFSYPPEPLTVSVSRGHRQHVEPISQALYVESLIEKYGTPAMDSGRTTTSQGTERTLEWPIGNGSIQCLTPGAEVRSTPPILERIARRLPDASPDSVETCISMLRYVLRGDPVVQASGAMFDVSAAARAEFRSQAWIQSLIDERSATGTAKPRL